MNFNQFKNSNSLLNSEQMKAIKGGWGTCGFLLQDGSSGCGYSQAEVFFMMEGEEGAHWCCDSCASSSYCGDQEAPD